ncbi:hypothetical protein MPL3356_150334 [Mesorhizobium plurifarium]|uniref:Uncharacterized protein n=1 Tax=Mesorhizobium plurifarium TaxID=69974 RepID=A0A090DL97_MESPL|nr:hypothetical protein MPL3356_150334 [Mesorhizobium plurifarium]
MKPAAVPIKHRHHSGMKPATILTKDRPVSALKITS